MPCGMWDLSSLTRDRTQSRTHSAVKVQNPNQGITREVPFSAFFDLHFVSSLLNFYFEIISDVQIHWYNATEFLVPRVNIFSNQIPISKAKKWALTNANAINKAIVAESVSPSPRSCLPRCVSGPAFFYTGERCQALQLHSSVLGLLIGGMASMVFLTFTIISILYQRSRQWCPRTSARSRYAPCPWTCPFLPVLSVVWGCFFSLALPPASWVTLLFSTPLPHVSLSPCSALPMNPVCAVTTLIPPDCKFFL